MLTIEAVFKMISYLARSALKVKLQILLKHMEHQRVALLMLQGLSSNAYVGELLVISTNLNLHKKFAFKCTDTDVTVTKSH